MSEKDIDNKEVKWEVGKKVRYKSTYSGTLRIARIMGRADDGGWLLNGGMVAYENDPKFELHNETI